VYICEMPDII